MATFPSSIGFAALDFRSNDPTLFAETHSGKINVRKRGAQYYSWTARYNKLTEDQVRPIEAFVASLRGRFTAFTITLPLVCTSKGVGGGSPLVAGVSQSGTTLSIDGCPPSTTGWRKAADVFTIAGDAKVYQLAADANTDAAGAVTLSLVQPLMASPADNAAISFDNVQFTARLANDAQKYAISPPDFYIMEIDMREDL